MLGSNPSADPRARPNGGCYLAAPISLRLLQKVRDGINAINPGGSGAGPRSNNFLSLLEQSSVLLRLRHRLNRNLLFDVLPEGNRQVPFTSEAPVDLFSQRPDQTPYRALSRKG